MTFGGMFSRWLHIDVIGVPFLIIGVKQAYKEIIKLVEHTKNVGLNDPSCRVVMLANKEFNMRLI